MNHYGFRILTAQVDKAGETDVLPIEGKCSMGEHKMRPEDQIHVGT